MNSELRVFCNSSFSISSNPPLKLEVLCFSHLFPSLCPCPFSFFRPSFLRRSSLFQIFKLQGGISERMNRWVYEQNTMAACQEMRMESVVCPKPRRLVLQSPPDNDLIRAHRRPISHPKAGDSKAGAELLDMILTKENYGENFSHQLATSPPFFWGSPPSRASNPLVQDEQFGNGNNTYQLCEGPPSPSTRKGGCARMTFGHRPAAIRIEGFDCLNRDARNCSISAVA